MQCKSCQAECLSGQRFCANCGAALTQVCRECSTVLEVGDKFCSHCGGSQPSLQSEQNAETDRRPVTALFCDLVGSTNLSAALDAEELRDIIRSYQGSASQIVSRYGGFISRFMGDGILVFFGYPVAQEDAAERAVCAALDLVNEIGGPDFIKGQELKVRIGVASGVVIAGDLIGEGSAQEMAVVGETPNLAARLQSVASPNQIAIADSTYRLIRGLFDVTDLGNLELKGFPQPRRCWRVDGAKEQESRFEMTHSGTLTSLVGRKEEVQFLRQRLETCKTGNGQVVLISADPGLGKSRMVQQVIAESAGEGFNVASFRCSPIHQNTALYPIIEFLNRWLDATEGVNSRLEALVRNLSRLGLNTPESVRLLASLLSIELPSADYPEAALAPQARRRRTHEILSEWITVRSEISPLLTVWEDLHWVDPSTLEVLALVVTNAENSQQLQLLTARPEFECPWEPRPYIATIVLPPLDEAQTARLISEMSEPVNLSSDIVSSLVKRSDGVPLFAEELAQMAIESSQVTDASLARMEIPSSLHDSLVSRLDRLGAARKIAQVSSVLGRHFTSDLLYHLLEEDRREIKASLDKLVETRIVEQQDSDPKGTYRFRHALIQDAAYRSILNRTRKQIHLQIADMFETEAVGTAAQEPEVLAYHLTEAGNAARAIDYWQQAATKASSRFDNAEAVSHLQMALEQLSALEPSREKIQTELSLLLSIGVPLTIIRGFASEELKEVYARARDICLDMGASANLQVVLNGLFRYYYVCGDVKAAYDITARLLTLAEEANDSGHLVFANQAYFFTLAILGRTAEARKHMENVDKYYNPEEHLVLVDMYGADALIAARTGGATCVLFAQGDFELAQQWIEEAIQLSRDQGNPNELAWSLSFAGVSAQQLGNTALALERSAECVEVSLKYGMPHWKASGDIIRGWSHWREGDTATGLELMRQGIAAWQLIGAGIFLCYWQSLLLSALVEEGLVEEGFGVYTNTHAHIEESQERWWEPEVERLHGELIAVQSSSDKSLALEVIERAIDIARTQEQPALELRGLMSIVRLDPSNTHRARLAECLSQFTQEYLTPDLIEATQLAAKL